MKAGPLRIGYARVSKDDQNLPGQLDQLERAGCHEIYREHVSGVKAQRPELAQALRACRAGDTLVVCDLTRIGRNLKELIAIMETLQSSGVQFESLAEKIDTSGAFGELVFHLFAALAQYERKRLIERTGAGLRAARARGRMGGRPPALTDSQIQKAKRLLADPDASYREVARDFGVNRSTLYASIKRYDAKQGGDHVRVERR